MPAVLVELGFLTNPGEEDFLQSTRGKELLASAVYRAIKSYKLKRESRDAILREESIFDEVFDAALEENSEDAPEEKATQPDIKEVEIDTPVPSNAVYYSIQIAVSRNDLQLLPENFMGLTDVYRTDVYGLYKYFYGKVSSYKEAEALKATATAHYPDAYIVAFKGSKKIDVKEAKKFAP